MSIKIYQGVIFGGPQRLPEREEADKIYVKVALSSDHGSSLVRGEPNLFGGILADETYGRWIPIQVTSVGNATASGLPRLGDSVLIFEDTDLQERDTGLSLAWAETRTSQISDASLESLDTGISLVTIFS